MNDNTPAHFLLLLAEYHLYWLCSEFLGLSNLRYFPDMSCGTKGGSQEKKTTI